MIEFAVISIAAHISRATPESEVNRRWPSCHSLVELVADLAKSPTMRNLRRIDGHLLVAVIDFYQKSAAELAIKDEWTAAYLIDGPNGQGILALARDDQVCASMVLSARTYRSVVEDVEGR